MLNTDKPGRYHPITLSLLVLLFALLTISSCNSPEHNDSELYWREVSEGVINTNDLERVKNTVPFEVITPDYLPTPTNLSTPDITLRYDEYGGISLLMQYFDLKNFRKISIQQWPLTESDNFYQTGQLSGFEIIKLGGLDVLVTKLPDQTYDSRQLNGYEYGWPLDGIQCWIQLRGYTQEEDHIIIESIIKQ